MILKVTQKPWGSEEILIQTKNYVIKRLHIKAGHRLSLQKHKRKIETLIIQQGECGITYKDKCIAAMPKSIIHIPRGTIHRIEANERLEDVEILEVSTPELEDVIRIEDDYGRV